MSFTKHLSKQSTAGAVMNKKTRMLKTDIDKNDEKIDEISQEVRRNKKAIRRRKQKDRRKREFSLRFIVLEISKTEIRNKIDASKQIILHAKEVKEQLKLKIEKLKKKENQQHY